eukprot:SRR837773.14470.p1 GENE.SRR837773.14470~~SRR837773.14470.p1  ORF type:complete len:154 (-),score=42.75 SRR837773.14470:407-823(-)
MGGIGMVSKAQELAEKNGWFLARQFETEDNAAFHKKTTGPEITAAFQKSGLKLDYFVAGYGTGGTVMGIGSHLKEASPETKVVLVEPNCAPLVSSGIPQERKEVMGVSGHPREAILSGRPTPYRAGRPTSSPRFVRMA